MARPSKPRSATIQIATIARMVAYIVAPLPLVPALLINLDWTQPWWSPWNLAAAGSILGSALFIEVALAKPSWLRTPLFMTVGLLLLSNNVLGAFANASHRSDHRSDHRRQAINTAKTQSSQRSQWSQGRTEAATVAGEKAADAYELEVQAAIAKDARRWQATGECDPQQITAGQSREFCSSVAELKAKRAAAKRRDDLDAKIAALDAKVGDTAEVPKSADPFADNLAGFLASFGLAVSDDMRDAFTSQRNMLNAIGLELLATFGPVGWLLFINGMMTITRPSPVSPIEAPAPARKPAKVEVSNVEEPAPPVPLADPFHAFVEARIEDCNGARMKADEPWQLWLQWCAERKIDTGSQKAFGAKMKTRFARDNNNNRPVYLNLRAKQAPPRLAIVGGQRHEK